MHITHSACVLMAKIYYIPIGSVAEWTQYDTCAMCDANSKCLTLSGQL